MNTLKRLVCFLLMLMLTLPSNAYASSKASDISYDILKAGAEPQKTQTTYRQFMAMLDVAVSHIDEARAKQWQSLYQDARSCNDFINWGNAGLALFSAAEFLGGDVYARNCNDKGEGAWNGEWTPAPFWGDVYRSPVGFEGMTSSDAAGDFLNWASHYITSRGSVLDGKTLYQYQNGSVWIPADQTLSLQEAADAVQRLWESTIVIKERYPSAQDESLFAEVEAKKQAILNSATAVEYTGKAYYVSNQGSDKNSGASPKMAWATLNQVNKAAQNGKLKPGDAVFFERGGLWRGAINCAPGVIYSAYGEGEKPRIYGSEENGAGAEKWTLWYEHNEVKIWKYYRDISEVGNIVFNEGESWATRVYAVFNSIQWVASASDNEPFDVAKNLKDNLTFYSTFEITAEEYRELASREADGGIVSTDVLDDTSGALYLRCDEGNPGELYAAIEFHNRPKELYGYGGLVNTAGNNVIDNLCLRYSLVNGIAIYGTDRYNTDNNNNVIQNCEIGWTGGTQHELCRPDGIVMVCGENIVFKTDGNVFENNYMYQSACAGFVSEFVAGEWGGVY